MGIFNKKIEELKKEEIPKTIPPLNDPTVICKHLIDGAILLRHNLLICGSCGKAVLVNGQWHNMDDGFINAYEEMIQLLKQQQQIQEQPKPQSRFGRPPKIQK